MYQILHDNHSQISCMQIYYMVQSHTYYLLLLQEGLQALVKISGALETIALCLMSDNRKTTLLTLQV